MGIAWGGHSLILMHTCVLMTSLLGGYLPCKKDDKVWYFLEREMLVF